MRHSENIRDASTGCSAWNDSFRSAPPSAHGTPAAKGFDSKGGEMAQHRLGVIMNGVTGRMGTNQHLVRSIVAIRQQGGVALQSGDRVLPDPILLGRNADKLEALARQHGIARWTTDLEAAL